MHSTQSGRPRMSAFTIGVMSGMAESITIDTTERHRDFSWAAGSGDYPVCCGYCFISAAQADGCCPDRNRNDADYDSIHVASRWR